MAGIGCQGEPFEQHPEGPFLPFRQSLGARRCCRFRRHIDGYILDFINIDRIGLGLGAGRFAKSTPQNHQSHRQHTPPEKG